MPARQTILRLKTLAYIVKSLWDFYVIHGGVST